MFGELTSPFAKLGAQVLDQAAATAPGSGLVVLLNVFVKLFIVVAGIYTFWNILIAGFGFQNAGGDSKAVQKAWDRIWQSVLGLTIVAGSFVLAAIFGWLIFGNATALLQPVIFSPSL